MRADKFILFLFCSLFIFGCAQQKTLAQETKKSLSQTKNDLDPRVEALLEKMTLQEKIGQMSLYTTDWGSTGPTIREGYKNDVKSGRCGALFNSHTVAFTKELQKVAVEESRLKIPLLFGYDVIHGYKTIFPIPLGEAASWDLQAIEDAAHVAAAESAAAGLHWTFAPMVDICRDPRWGRIMEGSGEDTYLGSRIAEARVRGFQGRKIGDTDRVLACVKHFAAYGAPMAGRDYNSVDMSERVLREVYLPPYEAAIKAGAATVMTSFNDYDGVPASGNAFLLKKILREEWDFKGFVVTDYTSINEMVKHGVVADDKEAGELALNAGVDMDMQGAVYQNFTEKSLSEGKVTEEQINTAVRRILKLKFDLGLFDDPYKFCNATREKQVVFSAANRKAAREMAQKSIVLLKNEGNILPLGSSIKQIALIGPLAEEKVSMMGNWSGAGDGMSCVSLAEGLKNRGNLKVQIEKGCAVEGMDKSGFASALAAAKEADVILMAVGELAAMSGEAAARAELGLPGVQNELVMEILALGKPVVVVLMNGRPLTIPDIAEKAPAIIETWWLGTEAGNAIADVLFGDYNPSAKLPVTFPRSVGQVPIFYNEKSTGRPFNPDSKWTSKYIDMPNSPQWPFGFGLSYTEYAYSDIKVDKATLSPKGTLKVSVQVKNVGASAGTETVQLYIHDKVASVTRPVKELKAFKQVQLKAGETQTVDFVLSAADFSFYRRNMTFGAESGAIDLFIGGDSQNLLKTTVNLEGF